MGMKPNELRDSLKGVIHLVMTPFNDKNELDEAALASCLKKEVQMYKGQDLVFLAGGSTAEFYAMNDVEFKRYAKTCVEAIGGKFPVVVAAGRGGTSYSLELSKYVQDVGGDGVMVVNPYYHPATKEGIYRHLETIANNLDIGVVLYNNPATSSMWVDIELMKKVSKIKNVVGLKENIGDIKTLYRMYRTIDPQDMAVFTGVGHEMYQYAALFGMKGFVTELANFAPEEAFNIYKAAMKKDFGKVQELCEKVDPIYAFIGEVASRRSPIPSTSSFGIVGAGAPYYQSVIKTAMELVGLPGGKVREPMENLAAAEKDELRQIMLKIGLNVVA